MFGLNTKLTKDEARIKDVLHRTDTDIKSFCIGVPAACFATAGLVYGAAAASGTVSVFAHGGNSWHLGLELSGKLNLIHIGNHVKYGLHMAIGYIGPKVADIHIYLQGNFPFFRIWRP